jgi:hypothetical protein
MSLKVTAGAKVERLLAAVLKNAQMSTPRQVKSWKRPGEDIRRLVAHDYVRSLRKGLGYRQVKTLLKAFQDIFPGFNIESLRMMSEQRFAEIAADMRFHLRATPYDGEEGLALRGFYVTSAEGTLKRPLVYINTAHHPLAAATTFVHELGHHVSAKLLALDEVPVHFFFDADYAAHLEEPGELAADVAVSLAGYPEAKARQIFAKPWDWGLVARAKNLTEENLSDVRVHLKRVYGFDLMEHLPADRRLHYLTGMIHYAKLRWAVLAEYDL